MMAHALLSTLSRVCPACDQLQGASAERCSACGAPLTEAPPGAARAPTPSPVPPGLRPATRPGPQPLSQPLPAAATPPVPMRAAPAAPAAPPPAPTGPTPAIAPPRPVAPAPGNGPTPAVPGPPGVAPQTPRPVPPQPAPGLAAAVRPPASGGSRYIVAVVAGSAPGQRFRLMAAGCAVGRQRGAILFPEDPFVSAQHATFRIRDGTLWVKDEGSVSGVYVSISRPEPLRVGGQFAAGSRLFRYAGSLPVTLPERGKPTPYGAPLPSGGTLYTLEELLVGGRPGRAVVTAAPLLTVGQAGCDFSFPPEAGLAPRHCEVSPTPQGAVLRDLSGGVGTYVRLLAEERALQPGDRVRIGAQTLLVELQG